MKTSKAAPAPMPVYDPLTTSKCLMTKRKLARCKHLFSAFWECWCDGRHRCCKWCSLPLSLVYRKNFLKTHLKHQPGPSVEA